MASSPPIVVAVGRRLLGFLTVLSVAGCAVALDLGASRANGPAPVNFPECRAESYDFVGEGTLRELGLDVATPVPPPNPGAVAMIWVTHDLKPYDEGAPGGPVEQVRMLCFEFRDGSGGSEWPVDPTWQPPAAQLAAGQGDGPGGGTPAPILLAGIIAAVLVAVSGFAFRRSRSSTRETRD